MRYYIQNSWNNNWFQNKRILNKSKSISMHIQWIWNWLICKHFARNILSLAFIVSFFLFFCHCTIFLCHPYKPRKCVEHSVQGTMCTKLNFPFETRLHYESYFKWSYHFTASCLHENRIRIKRNRKCRLIKIIEMSNYNWMRVVLKCQEKLCLLNDFLDTIPYSLWNSHKCKIWTKRRYELNNANERFSYGNL